MARAQTATKLPTSKRHAKSSAPVGRAPGRSRNRDRRIPVQADAPSLPDVARYLQDHLGQKLTAFLSGVSDPKTVGRWAAGKVQPPFAKEVRLRSAYDATRLICDRIGDESARAWFLGTSSFLAYTAPAVVLHGAETPEECRHIVPAALSFLEAAY